MPTGEGGNWFGGGAAGTSGASNAQWGGLGGVIGTSSGGPVYDWNQHWQTVPHQCVPPQYVSIPAPPKDSLEEPFKIEDPERKDYHRTLTRLVVLDGAVAILVTCVDCGGELAKKVVWELPEEIRQQKCLPKIMDRVK